MTVRAYRAGLCVVAASLLAAAGWQAATAYGVDVGGAVRPTWVLLAAGTALAVQDMHLYDKRIRWVIGGAAWTGVVLQLASAVLPPTAAHWVFHAGLGFGFVALSGFAVKERFCFRLPALDLTPLLLASSLVPLVGGWGYPAAALLLAVGAIYSTLAVAKVRMPLHFDVGDKSRYQI